MAEKPSTDAGEKRKREKEPEKPKREDHDLDQALADTFPASDPPARVVHGTASSSRPEEKE